MKLVLLILGIVLLGFGLCTFGWTWYDASKNGRYSQAGAYAGPVLIVLGLLRILRAASATPLPSLARIAVVGVAILLGYADSAAIKAIYPNDILEDKTSN